MNAFDLPLLVGQQNDHLESPGGEDQRLDPEIERLLDYVVSSLPLFSRLSAAGQLLIQTIHGIPDLDSRWRRDRLEFYLGRAGATASHVFGRFEHHHETKDHVAGIVVFRCSTEVVSMWEGVAIRVLKRLEERGRLCVANILRHGGGQLPSVDESVVYLTWRVLPTAESLTIPTRADVRLIAIEVSEEMAGKVSKNVLETALDPLTRPVHDRADLFWAEGHDD